jgi:hypothetical protein
MFQSRDAAWALATELSFLFPENDFEAWPHRGSWVLVMRDHDEHGHVRVRFVGHEAPLRKTKKHGPREKNMGVRGRAIVGHGAAA